MSRLVLGTAQFGLSYGVANKSGQVTREVAKDMLKLASSSGIDTIDTAISYGESESCLGEVGVKQFNVVTKLPALPENCPDIGKWVQNEVSKSLNRLGTATIYGLLLHRPEQLLGTNGSDLYKSLCYLKESGQVQKVGISIYSPRELESLIPKYRFDLVQAPFNLVDRRLKNTNWIYRLKQDDVEIHSRSAFLQGILLMSKEDIPAKFIKWGQLWSLWHKWLSDTGCCAVQACLSFPLSFPEIDRVIVGADGLNQLIQIVGASNENSTCNLPDIECNDEYLVNPTFWSQL